MPIKCLAEFNLLLRLFRKLSLIYHDKYPKSALLENKTLAFNSFFNGFSVGDCFAPIGTAEHLSS